MFCHTASSANLSPVLLINLCPELGEDGNKQLQNIMMQLRKAANHPLLHRTIYTTEMLQQMSKNIMREPEYYDANQTYIFEDMEVMSDFELHKLCRKFKVCFSSMLCWRSQGY